MRPGSGKMAAVGGMRRVAGCLGHRRGINRYYNNKSIRLFGTRPVGIYEADIFCRVMFAEFGDRLGLSHCGGGILGDGPI